MLELSEIYNNCERRAYVRGMGIYQSRDCRLLQVGDPESDGCRRIYGHVKGSGKNYYKAMLKLSETTDNIYDYECECPAYNTYYGLCKHCVSLALMYRERQLQNHSDENEKNNRNKLAEDLPTSGALREMIRRYSVRERMHLMGGLYREVRVEPVFEQAYSGLTMQLRIGTKRMYVVKNVVKLLNDIETVADASYGKNLRFVHDRSAFTQEALEWLALTEKILRQKGHYPQNYVYGDYREISLGGDSLDMVLMMVVGGKIDIDGRSYEVREGNPRLNLRVEAQTAYGAILSLEEVVVVCDAGHLYLQQGQTIWQCSSEYRQKAGPVIDTLNKARTVDRYNRRFDGLYLNKNDYESFCANVLPKIKDFFAIETEGIDLDMYMPKQAELQVYLSEDESESGGIVCRAEASYGNVTYDLLDPADATAARDYEREQELLTVLTDYFEQEETIKGRQLACRDDEAVYHLLDEGISKISSSAQLFLDEKLRGAKLVRRPITQIGVSVSSGLLELSVQADGMSPNEVADVLAAYRKKKRYYRMKNGDIVSLADSGLSTAAELLDGLQIDAKEASGSFSVPMYRSSYIDSVLKQEGSRAEIVRSTDFKALIRGLRNYPDSDFVVPAQLGTRLRPYQKDGFRWLSTLGMWGFGGILADDMGLGKTVQVLAFLLGLQERKQTDGDEEKALRALIVCPASLVYNWSREAARFAPSLPVSVVAGMGTARKKDIAEAAGKGVVITSYDLLKRDIDEYKELSFDCCIIDEAQYIKNAGTQVAKAVKCIRTGVRFALTGTPIENRLSDLWSIFDFLMPGYLFSYKKFREELELPIVQQADEQREERLRRLTAPFILRRKKQQVLKDLPDKLEEVVYSRMGEEQRRLYTAHVERLRHELAGTSNEAFAKESIRYLAELTRLRQICCSPALAYENYRGGDCKIETCLALVESAVQSGHRLLLFSQFTQLLERLQPELEKRELRTMYLCGRHSKLQRREMVDNFQAGGADVFLISLKAGGVGLNLTAADVVIHYDPWWNVAAQNQAEDRAHRIGQEKVVNVIRLVTENTIEERILELQQRKAALAGAFLEGREVADSRLSREGMLELLQI